jgi:hypothetical protein
MSRVKYWQYVCNYCGEAAHYHTHEEALSAGWKTRGKADFCSVACWRQSKEHSL